MGLDQYAYVAARKGQKDEWWEGAELDKETREYVNPNMERPRELMYWRKHPNLQGWMESLWKRKLHENNQEEPDADGWGSSFNGIELELTYDDVIELEQAVTEGHLPPTSGFFFGDEADEYYREQDLEFIRKAKAELFCGLRVFYNSSW